MIDNKSNHIISVDEKRFDSDNRSEDYQAYENLVKETIDMIGLDLLSFISVSLRLVLLGFEM